jgi:CheY-like chemotaxis protein
MLKRIMTTVPARSSLHRSPGQYRILYADDMPDLRDIMQLTMRKDGHSIRCVEDGGQALRLIKKNPATIDVLITDHHMPAMTGLELVRALRELNFPGKIVVFSSELSEQVSQAYQALKVDRMLMKPIFIPDLRQVLQELW